MPGFGERPATEEHSASLLHAVGLGRHVEAHPHQRQLVRSEPSEALADPARAVFKC
jgi:hypothetical protein